MHKKDYLSIFLFIYLSLTNFFRSRLCLIFFFKFLNFLLSSCYYCLFYFILFIIIFIYVILFIYLFITGVDFSPNYPELSTIAFKSRRE